MLVRIQLSEEIRRPMAVVFQFYAREHVRNHPRWDPNMQLEQVTDGPIGLGTIIHRINSRSGAPVEGTIEIVEFEPDRAVGMTIHDGPVVIRGRATLEANSDARTLLKFDVELPGMDETMDTSTLAAGIQQSLENIKRLIEFET